MQARTHASLLSGYRSTTSTRPLSKAGLHLLLQDRDLSKARLDCIEWGLLKITLTFWGHGLREYTTPMEPYITLTKPPRVPYGDPMAEARFLRSREEPN